MTIYQSIAAKPGYCFMQHNVAQCDMSAIRVSIELFEEAKKEASAMNRSVAGQFEYWARIGQAVEAAGFPVQDVKELFYRKRVASEDPFARLVNRNSGQVHELPGSAIQAAKHLRQRIDYEAQRAGLVSSSRISPFAGVQIAARIREVPLDD